jgi:hypothetical protein
VNTWQATPDISQVNLAWWEPSTGRSPEYIWRKATREQEDGLHSSGSREKPRYGADTTGCRSTAIGARSRAASFTILPPSHTLLQECYFMLLSGAKTQSRRSLRTS